MLKTTPLLSMHQSAGAKLVDFSGWQMPLHYGSQLQEHHAVRTDAGMFDVSHMAIVEVSGEEATSYLRYLLANDVAKLKEGKALYTCMLNLQGGIIDDLIVYKMNSTYYRLVLNAGTREKDWHWLQTQQKTFDCQLKQRDDLGILAIQGPHATAKLLTHLDFKTQTSLKALKPFESTLIEEIFYSRTGYTGEEGFEIQIPAAKLAEYWEQMLSIGIKPCGLAARDTLRLEAGLNLYGLDMDESTTPLESNLNWTVAYEPSDRVFIGREALEKQKTENHARLVGVILPLTGILRHQQKIWMGDQSGEVTSGTFSPTLGYSIGLARIPADFLFKSCEVEIRQRRLPVELVRPPFVRQGRRVYTHLSN